MNFQMFTKKLQLIHLGGMEEIGKNMTLLKYGNNILIIDCGMKFPDDDMPGIDKVLPDMSYLVKNKKLVRGLVLTHGHEDHIGAIPYLLKDINVPIYGTKLTLGLVEHKLKEARLLKSAKLNVVKPRDVINLGPFKVEFIRVCHSIADSAALSINTPSGTIVHTGDFKIDYSPLDGELLDQERLKELGDEGVLALLSDSTNADQHGTSPSERIVGETFRRLFPQARGRILVALFASNINRIQQVVNVAQELGKKVAISGLSMQTVINKAKELGYIKIPDDILIKLDEVGKIPPSKLVIITTGSQGEPMSALTRMAGGEHKQIKISRGDTVIISATPIPGNEKSVYKTVNKLFKLGAEVIYGDRNAVHVSGHGCQEDMKTILTLVRPKFFFPVHGESRHLVAHYNIALEAGMPPENILINQNGDVTNLSKDQATRSPRLKLDNIFVDGNGVGDVGPEVLEERRRLADDGIVVISVIVSKRDFRRVSEVDIQTKGFVFLKLNEDLIQKSKEITETILSRSMKLRKKNIQDINQEIRYEVGKMLRKKTERLPVILPLITQI